MSAGEASQSDALYVALSGVDDPEIRRPITELGMVPYAGVTDDGVAHIDLRLTISGCPAARQIENAVREAALGVAGVKAAEVAVSVMSPSERREFVERVRGSRSRNRQELDANSLTRIIVVTSGKGGVGKSSVTAGLAVALANLGRKVGLIDADVFGFSIPGLLGLTVNGHTPSPTRVDDLMLPPVAHGVKAISIGMFLGDEDARDTAVSWRGPMLHRTIEQFLRDVHFGDLDYLLVDMPPGTGDIAISVGQLLPHAEVIVVTTPQLAAADVAVRSALVARQTGQRVRGVIETMSAAKLPDGTLFDLFGSGGGAEVASRLSQHDEHVPLLGSLPLSQTFRADGDAGKPAVLAHPDDPAAAELTRVAVELDKQGRELSGRKLDVSPANS